MKPLFCLVCQESIPQTKETRGYPIGNIPICWRCGGLKIKRPCSI